MMANIFNRPVYVVQSHETTGLGAAVLGYWYLGIYQTVEEAVDEMIHVTHVYEPQKEDVIIYEKLYENIYQLTYKRLKPVYRKMADLACIK